MKCTELVKAKITEAETTQKAIADFMGCTAQNFSTRLNKGTLTFDEVEEIMNHIGYELTATPLKCKEKATIGNTTSPRLVQMVDGVTYDTAKATSICDSRESPEDAFYMELFREPSGAFFVGYYQVWDGGYNHISPTSKSGARAFYKRYSKDRDEDGFKW